MANLSAPLTTTNDRNTGRARRSQHQNAAETARRWIRTRPGPADNAAPSGVRAAGAPIVAQFGGEISNVAVIGDHAYVGSGTRILVLDVSDPAHPVQIGRSDALPSPVHHLAADDGHLYAANDYVTTFDLTEPTHPRVLGMIGAGACRVVPNGRYLYPMAGCAGFPMERVLDVADPSHPTRLGELPTSQPHEDLVVAGDVGYAIYNVFLQLLDMGDPAAPRKVGEIDTDPHGLNRLVYDAPTLYAASERGLVRYDVSFQMYPVPAATYDAGERGLALAERSGTAYLVTASGLSILDVTQPTTISLRARVDVPGAKEVTLHGAYAYVTGANGVTVVDVRDADHPAVTAHVPILGTAYEAALAGDVALVAAGDAGLAVVDLADATEPRVLATLAVGFAAEMIAVETGRAYLVGLAERLDPAVTRTTLAVVDVTTVASPALAGSITLPGRPRDVAASDGTVYVAGVGGAVAVIDVRNAAAPRHVASVPSGDLTPNEVLVDGTTLYLVESHREWEEQREEAREVARLRLFDVTGLPEVRELGSLDFDSRAESRGMALSVDRLYVPASRDPIYRMFEGEGREDLLAVDVTAPAQPRGAGFLSLDGFAKDIAVVGDTAYVAAGRDEFRFDMQEGESLIVLPGFAEPGGPRARWVVGLPAVPRSVAVRGDHAVLALREGGLAVVDVRPEVISQATATSTATAVLPPTNTAAPGTVTETPLPTRTPRPTATLAGPGSATVTPQLPATVTPSLPGTPVLTATVPAPATGTAPADAPAVVFRRLGQFGGESRAVAVSGEHVLLGLGSRVEVLDMSDGAVPTKVGQYVVPGIVAAIALDADRDLAYVIETGGRFHVLDVSAIDHPTEIGVLAPPPDLHLWYGRLVPDHGHVYVAAADGLGVIDVTRPTDPTWVGITPAAGAVTDIALSGDHLLVSSRVALQVFDLSDPAHPAAVGSAAILPDQGERVGRAESVAVAGDTAYVAAWAEEEWFHSAPRAAGGDARLQAPAAPMPTLCFILAFDVRDPAAPVEVGRFDASHMMELPGRLAVMGDRLFLEASQYGGPWTTYGVAGEIFNFDLAQPHEPRLLGQFDWHADSGSDIVAAASRLYVPEWHGGLRTLDASAPVTPTLLSTYDVPFAPRAIGGQAGRLVVGDPGTAGLWAIDAREPALASADGHIDLGRGFCGADCEVVLWDGIAYMADQNEGLLIVDAGEPGAPRELARLPDIGDAYALVVDDRHAYVGITTWAEAATYELVVVDVGDLAAPRVVGRVAVPGEVADLAFADGLVYAATAAGLVIVQVTDPVSPVVVGALGVGGSQVAAAGTSIYLVEVNGTFHVIDAANPTRPIEVGWLDKAREDDVRPNFAYEMRATADTVYVMHLKWLQAIDVRDPRAPRELGWIGAAALGAEHRFIDMALDGAPVVPAAAGSEAPGDVLYIASQEDGVFVVEANVEVRPPAPAQCAGCRLWLPAISRILDGPPRSIVYPRTIESVRY